MSQQTPWADEPTARATSPARGLRRGTPQLPGPRALWPHERADRPRSTRHPSAAFPLMAPASAQGRPRSVGPRLEARVDALLAEAQQALQAAIPSGAASELARLLRGGGARGRSGPADATATAPSPRRLARPGHMMGKTANRAPGRGGGAV